MRTSKRVTPQLEGFESRALLSGVAPVAPMIYPPPLLVAGHTEGAALIQPSLPDVGTQYHLIGIGNVGPMGAVAVHGSLQTSSFSGRPMGKITLVNGLGSIELEITDRASPLTPDAYHFVVSSATGAYADQEGTDGVLELRVNGKVGLGTFEMDINPYIPMAT
jgi:hypothetical protein